MVDGLSVIMPIGTKPGQPASRVALVTDRVEGIMAHGILTESTSMKKWQCVVCGLIYDEAEGWPEDGIEPGTKWEDVPDDWVCPDCGVGKEDFEMIEIG